MGFEELLLYAAALFFLFKGATNLKKNIFSSTKIKVTGKESYQEKIDKLDGVIQGLASSDPKIRRSSTSNIYELRNQGWDTSKALDSLEKLLTDDDLTVRYNTLLSLGQMHKCSPAALAQINLLLITDKEPYIRRAAATALQGIWSPDSVPYLTEALKDSEPRIQYTAVYALNSYASTTARKAVPQLIEVLKTSKDKHLLDRSIDLLGKIGPPAKDAIPELLRLWNEDKKAFGHSISEALEGDLGTSAACFIPIFAKELEESENQQGSLLGRYRASDVLASIGEEAIPTLLNLLKKEEKLSGRKEYETIQSYAKQALKKIGAIAIGPLLKELAIENYDYQSRVLDTLEDIGLPTNTITETLTTIIAKSESKITAKALGTLARLSTSLPINLLPIIRSTLSSQNPFLRESALLALIKHFPRESIDEFSKALLDKTTQIRLQAIRGLEATRESSAATLIRPLLKDPDKGVCLASIKALGSLRSKEVVEDLVAMLEKLGKEFDTALIDALYKINTAEALNAIKQYRQHVEIPQLVKTLETEPDSYAGEAAARILGELKASQAIPVLINALSVKNSGTRKSALRSIATMPDLTEQTNIQLIKALQTTDYPDLKIQLLDTLVGLGVKATIPLLLIDLKSDNPEIRKSAALLLRSFAKDASPAIPQLLQNSLNDDYDQASLEALIAIGDPAIQPLAELLMNKTMTGKAAFALARIGTPFALDTLVSKLKDLSLAIETADEEDSWQLAATLKLLGQVAFDSLNKLANAVRLKDVSRFGECRVITAAALLNLKDPKLGRDALFLLGQALQSDSCYAREDALKILEEEKTKEAEELLKEHLVFKLIRDLEERSLLRKEEDNYNAAFKLGILNNPNGNYALQKFAYNKLPYLLSNLAAKRTKTQYNKISPIKAIGSLGEYGRSAIPALLILLESPAKADYTDNQVLWALWQIGDTNYRKSLLPCFLERFKNGNYAIADLVIDEHCSSEFVDALLLAFETVIRTKDQTSQNTWAERNSLINALARVGHRCIKDVIKILNSAKEPIVSELTGILTKIGAPSVLPLFDSLTEPKNLDVKIYTLTEIAKTGLPAISDGVRSLLSDHNALKRHVSSIFLSYAAYTEDWTQDKEFDKILELLNEAINSEIATVRAAAYLCLMRLESNDLLPKIKNGLNDIDTKVSIAVLKSSPSYALAECLSADISNLLTSKDWLVASAAARALRLIGSPQKLSEIRKYADRRVPSLIDELGSNDFEIVVNALKEVEDIGDSRHEVISALVSLLDNKYSSMIQISAAKVLANISPKEALKQLKNQWRLRQDVREVTEKLVERIELEEAANYLRRYTTSSGK